MTMRSNLWKLSQTVLALQWNPKPWSQLSINFLYQERPRQWNTANAETLGTKNMRPNRGFPKPTHFWGVPLTVLNLDMT